MPNAINVENMGKINADLEGLVALWVVDYRGLTVKESEQIRRSITAAGAKMAVYKNTLVRKAIKEAGLPELDEILNGPSAFVFAAGDPVASAKAVKQFAEATKKLTIKGGIMDGEALNAEQVEAIAALPSRDELIGQIACSLTQVASQLAIALGEMSEKEAAAA